jgi:hypothetical protein
MLADLGLTPESTGSMLHVNPRTVRYWISGKTLIPYSAYRLLRILTGAELPSNGWDGWHMHSGKLWSPEGHGFLPSDSSWWGLLVRQARGFKTLYDQATLHRQLAIRSGDVAAAAGGACAAGPLAVVGTSPEKAGNSAVLSGGAVTRHFSLTSETLTKKSADLVRLPVTPHSCPLERKPNQLLGTLHPPGELCKTVGGGQ